MMEESTKRRRGTNWRWQEKLAASYLCVFLLLALVGPTSGWPPNPNKINLAKASTPPFSFSEILDNETINWLGTDALGRDVLANLITGAQTALLVSVPAMLLATIIGIALGSLAGFWGNTGFRVSLVSLAVSVLVLLASVYYGFYMQQLNWGHAFQTGSEAILKQFGYLLFTFTILGILGWLLVKVLQGLGLKKKVNLPVDQLILKLIEIIGSVPRLLLVMCLAAFARPALVNIVLLATLTYWASIARLVRSELLQIRELPYVQAARAVGLSEKRILFREALPNALPPVIVAVAFGLGSLMSLEATLSFLNIGVPTDIASWGRMMKGIQANYQAWWLLFLPAVTLCSTILSLQVLAQRILVKIDPVRNK